MNVSIHPFDWQNINQYLELYLRVFTKPPWNDTDSEEVVLAYFKALGEMNRFSSFVLYDEDCLIGLCLGFYKPYQQGTEYFIEQFCIDSDKQGHGYGGTFLSLIQDEVKGNGADAILLSTDLGTPAYSFYQKQGYQELKNSCFFAKVFSSPNVKLKRDSLEKN